MPAFHKVAKAADLLPGTMRHVEVLGHGLALYNLGGTFYATDDCCTHAEGRLSEGLIAGEEVVCPLHAATFHIRTGQVTSSPATEDLRTYPVRVVGADIEVEL